MQYLAAFLASFFGGIITFLAQYMTRKAAAWVTTVAIIAAITASFYAAIQALMTGIAAQVGDSDFVMLWWSLWPTNGNACISACLAADVSGFIYRYQKRQIQMIAQS